MSLFHEATNRQAFLKMGLYGSEGTGKTMTAFLVALGLHRHIKSKKPIAFFDTETGSDFTLELAKKAGVKLLVVKARSIEKLGEAFKEAPSLADIFLIDSITHPYKELTESYLDQAKKKYGKRFITVRDWGIIKPLWAQNFSTPFVNSPLHCIWCSRSKNLFEEVEDEEAGGRHSTKMVSLGTAPRSETESAYEPSLLVEMSKVYHKEGGKYYRHATVVKDRTMRIDSKEFDFEAFDPDKATKDFLQNNPTFQAFLPHIQHLNLGGEHEGFDPTTSAALFDDGPKDVAAYQRKREIALENIENGLAMLFPGSTGKDKSARLAILSELAGTASETALKQKPAELLERIAGTLNVLGQQILDGFAYESIPALQKEVRRLFEKPEPTPQEAAG